MNLGDGVNHGARTLDTAALGGAHQLDAGLSALVGADREVPQSTVLHHIERQAAHNPAAVAVASGGRELCYGDMIEAAGRTAVALRLNGVEAGDRVAVCAERGTDLLVGMLAAWTAGATYLPIDPAHPEDWISYVLHDASVRAVLSPRALSWRMRGYGLPVAVIGQALHSAPGGAGAGPRPDGAAYVIYTSGSTGRPKGVEVGHRALLNVVRELGAATRCGTGDRWLSMAPASFDISMAEFCVPLAHGARLVVPSEKDLRDARVLVRMIGEHRVTRMQAVPSQWRMLLDAGFDGPSVIGMVGGEAVPAPLAQRLRDRLRLLLNGYGPTETAVLSTLWPVPGAVSGVSLGDPIANTRLYVVGERLDLVPAGTAGELCIAGAGLATGYIGHPARTAERFVPDPFGAPGSRMYRTGDRCRWDGELTYLGREDGQVKVRGQRVELGEVEARLAEHPGVAGAAVALRGPAGAAETLVAYLVPAPGASPDPDEVRVHAARTMPPAMVPNAVVVLAEFPLTPNGKVDRAALPWPPPDRAPDGGADGTGEDPVLREVRELCRQVLQVDRVAADDDLFALGGHSLAIMQIAARIQSEWGVEIPIQVFDDAENVAELAQAVARARAAARTG